VYPSLPRTLSVSLSLSLDGNGHRCQPCFLRADEAGITNSPGSPEKEKRKNKGEKKKLHLCALRADEAGIANGTCVCVCQILHTHTHKPALWTWGPTN
jgi:hypothetical protein